MLEYATRKRVSVNASMALKELHASDFLALEKTRIAMDMVFAKVCTKLLA
jgi:hypothetical protein